MIYCNYTFYLSTQCLKAFMTQYWISIKILQTIHSEVKNVVWNEVFFLVTFMVEYIKFILNSIISLYIYIRVQACLENMVSCLFCCSFIKCHEKIVQWTIRSFILAFKSFVHVLSNFFVENLSTYSWEMVKRKRQEKSLNRYFMILCACFMKEKKSMLTRKFTTSKIIN